MYFRRQVVRGEVSAIQGDTVFLRLTPTNAEAAITLSSALHLERSLGVRSRFGNALRLGFATGALFGAAVGLTNLSFDGYANENRAQALWTAAAIGFATGAAQGAIFPTEHWEEIPLRP